MFFFRWSAAAQIVSAVILIGLAPVIVTELGASGFDRFGAFIHRWQPLIAGSFAVVAAFITINEMRIGRQKTEEFWVADRARLRRLEVSQARKTIHINLEPRVTEITGHRPKLQRMLQPADFDIQFFNRVMLTCKNAGFELIGPEVSDAFSVIKLDVSPIVSKCIEVGEAGKSVHSSYLTKLVETSNENDNGKNDFASKQWHSWRAELADYHAKYENFVEEFLELFDAACEP